MVWCSITRLSWGFGPNAANPHYEPVPGEDLVLEQDMVVLLDLWGGPKLGTVFADQTWMGFSGRTPPMKVQEVWRVVRDARDAAIAVVERKAGKEPLYGYQGDEAARGVITAAGYGPFFVHRTGIRSTVTCMALGRTSTTTRLTTTARSCPAPASRWSRGSTCRGSSGCGAK